MDYFDELRKLEKKHRRHFSTLQQAMRFDTADERDRLRHAIQNIQIQVEEGSEAREICDRVLRGEFYP
jgi:hypothetical protein